MPWTKNTSASRKKTRKKTDFVFQAYGCVKNGLGDKVWVRKNEQ